MHPSARRMLRQVGSPPLVSTSKSGMDVTCERCGTEYDFDETLVSERGTRVKCTNCGHVFKVYRPQEKAERAPEWRVRLADGTEQNLSSLNELRRKVAAGDIRSSDQIWTSDHEWKSLGEIPELNDFFEGSGRPPQDNLAPSVPSQGKQRRNHTPPGVPFADVPTGGSARPQDAIPRAERAPTRSPMSVAPPGTATARKRTLYGIGAQSSPPATSSPQSSSPQSSPAQADSVPGLVRNSGSRPPESGHPQSAETAQSVHTAPTVPPSVAFPDPSLLARATASDARSGPQPSPEPTEPAPGAPAAASRPAAHAAGPSATAPTIPGQPLVPSQSSTPQPPARRISPTRIADPDEIEEDPTRRRSAPAPRLSPSPPPSRPPSSRPPSVRLPQPGPRSGQTAASPASTPAKPLYIDEAEEHGSASPRAHRGSGLMGWSLGLIFLLGIGGGAAYWKRDVITGLLSEPKAPNPVEAFLSRGDEALRRDEVGGYEEAVREYIRATAIDGKNPLVLASLSRAHAAWSQALLFDASDLDEAAKLGNTDLVGKAELVRREANRHSEIARRYAADGTRHDPQSAAAELALSDALRLLGESADAKSHLDRASSMSEVNAAEAHYVRALLLAQEPGHSLADAIPEARSAASADKTWIRARLLLARAHLAAGDLTSAKTELETVLRNRADHPRASRMLEAIAAGAPPAVVAGDAGVDGSVDAATETSEIENDGSDDSQEGRAEQGTDEPRSNEADPDRPVPTSRDYSWYIRKGEEQLDRGRMKQAQQYFDQALKKRPGAAEALSGLGYIALNMGDVQEAARRFRPASQAGFGEAFIGLGDAYRRLGRKADALRAYRSYLERQPNGAHAYIARRQIETLEAEAQASPGTAGGTTDAPSETPQDTAPSDPAESDPPTAPSPEPTAPEPTAPEPTAPESRAPESAAPEPST